MPFDCLVEIDGIPGESTDGEHKDWIEIHSYSCGCSQTVGGSACTGGVRFGEHVDTQGFSIQKDLGKSSASRIVARGRFR